MIDIFVALSNVVKMSRLIEFLNGCYLVLHMLVVLSIATCTGVVVIIQRNAIHEYACGRLVSLAALSSFKIERMIGEIPSTG